MKVEYPVAHAHTQNGITESFIKRLQLIARPLLMKSVLPTTVWGHAILHAASLVHLRPTHYNKYSPLKLVFGHEPNIAHLRIFGCVVYVHVAPPQRTKMGPQRRLDVYVGFDSPSIILYLEPLKGNLFTARFGDFPQLEIEKKKLKSEIAWKVSSLSHFDPRSPVCEQELSLIHIPSPRD